MGHRAKFLYKNKYFVHVLFPVRKILTLRFHFRYLVRATADVCILAILHVG